MRLRKRSQKKKYILPIIFSIIAILAILPSCSDEGSVYRIQYPKFRFDPYIYESGTESGYAEVTFLSADNENFPKVVEIDGKLYQVAIFNGYDNKDDLQKLTEINVDPAIVAINSHAYENASTVTEMSIPNVTSLGTSCLPENLTSLTVNVVAVDGVGTGTINNALPNPEKLETLTLVGSTTNMVDLSGLGGKESSLSEITIDQGATWPILPVLVKEGMTFSGWYTDDPKTNPDAVKATAGTKPAEWPTTVYPYFEESGTPGEEEPVSPSEIPGFKIIRTYVLGIPEDALSVAVLSANKIKASVTCPSDWTVRWTGGGSPQTLSDGYVFTDKTGGFQAIGYFYDTNGTNKAIVMIDTK